MSMNSGITVVCDDCGYDCSDEKRFRGFRGNSWPSLESVLVKAGWSVIKAYRADSWQNKKHYCPKCIANTLEIYTKETK